VLKLLLQDKRVDSTVNLNSAFQRAAQRSRVGVVKLLLEDKRVDPTAENNSAFWRARNAAEKVDVTRDDLDLFNVLGNCERVIRVCGSKSSDLWFRLFLIRNSLSFGLTMFPSANAQKLNTDEVPGCCVLS
jgi:hypothetical protein